MISTITRRMNTVLDDLQREFKSICTITDVDAKMYSVKAAGSKSDRASKLRKLLDLLDICGISYERGRDNQYYENLIKNAHFPDFSEIEERMIMALYSRYKEYPNPEEYMLRIVNRLCSNEDLWMQDSLRLRILKQFMKYGNYLSDADYGGRKAITDYAKTNAKKETLSGDDVILFVDDGIFSCLQDATKAEKKPKGKYGLIKLSDDLATGKFRAEGSTKKGLYLFAMVFGMTYFSGKVGNGEILDYRTDIEINLFRDYYSNNLMRFISDSYRGRLCEYELDPSGQGINYKNFAEMIYVYFISQDIEPVEKIRLSSEMIKRVQSRQFKSGSAVLKSERNTVYYKGLVFGNTPDSLFCEDVLKLPAEEFEDFICEYYDCDTYAGTYETKNGPVDSKISEMQLQTEQNAAYWEYQKFYFVRYNPKRWEKICMSGRSYLKEKIMLCGESDGVTFKRTFRIVKKISEGASVICYEAYHENSGHGILKEFYPQDAFGVSRDKKGQIVHSSEFKDAYKRFESAMAEYVEPYEMLLTAKRNDISQELATFIPPFEIYHGCDDDGVPAGTIYIWTPEPKLVTFDKICEDIHKHPTKKPEHKLVTVLSAMDTLAKCICSLHSADMLHRDIKPSNFGFIKRGDDTLTQTLSMFDINTICSVYGDLDSVVGSPGYMEPEAGYDIASNQTDIYAIGATLFHAIIVCDETGENGYIYQKDYYDQIQNLVDNSKLIQASEANSHPRLRNILAKILRKCLCERAHRYENCEELIEDLDIALYYALPSEIAQKHKSGATWILADVEKTFDNKAETNSTLAIQQLLFEHPLYQYAEDAEPDINILVVGFGNYGQKFLDAVLQVGQMRNKRLNVMVISDDVTDKQLYISERPALTQFFNIDGSIADSETSYGSVSFSVASLERKNLAANAEILQNLTLAHYESSPLHYIFTALGDDVLNRSAANACLEVADVLERKCTISYVCEGTASGEHSDPLTPVFVRGEISETPFYNEIERMAFNTHLIWEKNLNIDARKVKAEFKKKYNYNSCVSSVLSLKYKLFSVGIDLDQLTYVQAAQMFTQMIADKKNRGIKDELIWIEHRRWVTEKICLGWQGITDLNNCVSGVTKDEKRKRHVCILRSRPNQKLASEYKVNGSYDKWDSASDSEIALLDDLDQMSVRLHRVYRQKANEIRTENLLAGHSIAVIREQITGNKNATATFQEWYSCLKDIWNGDSGKVRLYKGLKETFLRSSERLPFERKKAIAEQVKSFETLYFPIISSMEYRDWKQDDVAMIDNIPFVLTYSENAYMIIPYVIGDNTAVFGNVAAPTIVNPTRVLYLYMIENKYDVIALKDALPYVVEYMQKKKLKSKIEIVLLYHRTIGSAVPSNLDEDIFTIGNKRILHPIKHIVYDSIEELPTAVSGYLAHRSKGKSLFAIEKNISRLSSMLQVSGVYNGFANYQFDSQNTKFHSLFGCEAFGYIKKAAYISVSDMVSFKLSSSESSNQPEFFLEYKDLWKKYAEKSSTWKALCDALSEHSVKHDVIATFKKLPPREKLSVAEEYRYTLPFECCNNAMKIMDYLKSHGVLEANSFLSGYTSNSCEIRIVDKCGYKKEYDRLFANVYALMTENAISINLNTRTHDITVLFNNLIVTGVQLTGVRSIELQALLEYFNQEGYIINLTKNVEGHFSFTYATLQIKELLTTAGKILEVYTYHKAKETGRFDDIVSSYELEWEDTPVKNEFDCILTKGFRTLFVECKARADIEQDFYYKLSKHAEQFGINATAVLIADTQEKPFYDNAPVNALQRKRGNMMDVVTIWKQDEINNIGHTLLKIINGNYIVEEG